jgi:long-chain fatty acid transport protein
VAHASPLFELVGGVGGRAGLNGRGAGASAASTYFNPALLPKAEPGFETGVLILNDAIELSLDGRSNVDIPVAYRGATHADGSVFAQPSLPTAWLRGGCAPPQCAPALAAQPRQSDGSSGNTHGYQLIGLTTQLLGPQLVLGFYGLVPLARFTTAHSFFVDEREQFFTNSLHPELYSDRLTATSLAFGVGSQLTKRLSLGVSFTLGLHNTTRSASFVGNADELSRTLVVSNDIGVQAELSPHFGISYDATDRLHLSATAHSVQQFDIVTGITTLLPNGNEQTAMRTEVHDYLPWRFGVGVAVDVVSDHTEIAMDAHELTLCATAVLSTWSGYLDRQGERPLAPYAWSNTLSFGVGARHNYGHLRTFLDLQYVPSPVPLQTGRTNYVDNNRISTSGGVDYRFELFSNQWRVGLQAQLHVLLRRYQQKVDPAAANSNDRSQLVRDEFPDDAVDTRGQAIPSAKGLQTNNPGWPGFASSGVLSGGGLTLAWLF